MALLVGGREGPVAVTAHKAGTQIHSQVVAGSHGWLRDSESGGGFGRRVYGTLCMDTTQQKIGVFGWCRLTAEGCGARIGTTINLKTNSGERGP